MREETVRLPSPSGLWMVGTLLLPETAGRRPGVVVVHGFRGHRNERHVRRIAERITEAGLITLRVDLTNNLGESEGQFSDLTLSQEVADAQAALDYLAAHPEVDGRLGITGHSLGGLVAALVAARDPRVQALVTLSAVFDFPQLFQAWLSSDELAAWRQVGSYTVDPLVPGLELKMAFLEDLQAFAVAQEAAQVQAPALVVQGDADAEVPPAHGHLYLKHLGSARKELHLLRGADHCYSRDEDLESVAAAAAAWFRRVLGHRRSPAYLGSLAWKSRRASSPGSQPKRRNSSTAGCRASSLGLATRSARGSLARYGSSEIDA